MKSPITLAVARAYRQARYSRVVDIFFSCRRRRKSVPQKATECGQKTLRCRVVALGNTEKRLLFKLLVHMIRTGTDHRHSSKKKTGHSTSKKKI